MNKPNGISDKVWEMAEELIIALEDEVDFSNDGRIQAKYMDAQYEKVQTIIAIAISKAIEDERALILDDISMTAGSNVSLKDGLQAIRDSILSRSKGEE